MYKNHLQSQGFDMGQLTSSQKETLNQILRLESSNRRSMMNEDATDEENEVLKSNLIALKSKFESELKASQNNPKEKEIIPLTKSEDEPPSPPGESKSELGFFAMLGVAALGLLFIASGVMPKDE